MSTCMYCCWLPTRVLYSAASRAAIGRGHPRRSASSGLGHPHTSSGRGQPHSRSTSNVRSPAHNAAGARNGAPRWLSSRSDTLYTVSGDYIEAPKDAESSLADSDSSLHKQTHASLADSDTLLHKQTHTSLADTDTSLHKQNHTNLADTDTLLHTQNCSNLADNSASTHIQTHSSLAYTDAYTCTQTRTNTDASQAQTKLGVTNASLHARTHTNAHTRLADTNASLTTHSQTPSHKEFTRTLNTETHHKDNTKITINLHTNKNTDSRTPHTQIDTNTSLNTPTSTNSNRLRNSSKSSSNLHQNSRLQKPTIPELNNLRPLSRSASGGRLQLSAPTQYSITSEFIFPIDSESVSSGRPHSPDEARHSLLTTSGDFDPATAEMSSKRSQDALTPTRNSAGNKKKKVKSAFLDQIPLPKPTPLESIPLPKTPKSTPLEFIPLPKSPLREQEDDSNDSFGDFFILDTAPSEVVFPELPKRGKNNGGASNKFSRNSTNKAHDKKSNEASNRNSNKKKLNFENPLVNQISDDLVSSSSVADESTSKLNNNVVKDDDIEYVSSECGTGKSPRKNNRRRKCRRSNSQRGSRGTSSANDSAALMDDDEIGIVFEGPGRGRPNDVTVVGTVSGASGSRQGIKTSPGLSSLPTSSSPPSTSQSARLCHTRSGQGLKTKATEDEVSSSSAASVKPKTHGSEMRDSSPGIEKVNVIDPDVVQIEEQPGCSQDVEVIDVFKDSTSDDSASEDETGEVEVENDDFLTLGRLKVKDLTNTDIDIDDETLELRRRLENMRCWDMTGLGQDIMSGKSIKPTDMTFTVLSYNVLAQSLLTDNMSLYRNCDSANLDWKYRWALLQHEVEGLDPDILLLQEVQASHYHTEYLPWFTFLGFDGLYKKRTGMKSDGCAIFYKRSKFSLLEHCSVEYLQPQATDVLDRDNIALIAKLASVKEPRAPPLCVATTHILYNPRRHDVKLAQSVLLLSEIDRICFEGEEGGRNKYCPVLVTGDFNAEPHTTLMDFVKFGRLQYEGLSCKTLARHGSFNKLLDASLIPPALGITDRCQHSVLAQGRMMEKMHGPIFRLSDKRKLEESLIKLHHSDRLKNELTARQPTLATNGPTQSGWLSHGFNFKSVYHHRNGKHAPEATTHQGTWTTVDYMLYNRVYSHAKAKSVEGNLKLLARYRLLTGPEAERFAPLPSSVCPSDHFPLAAQFLLRR